MYYESVIQQLLERADVQETINQELQVSQGLLVFTNTLLPWRSLQGLTFTNKAVISVPEPRMVHCLVLGYQIGQVPAQVLPGEKMNICYL